MDVNSTDFFIGRFLDKNRLWSGQMSYIVIVIVIVIAINITILIKLG